MGPQDYAGGMNGQDAAEDDDVTYGIQQKANSFARGGHQEAGQLRGRISPKAKSRESSKTFHHAQH